LSRTPWPTSIDGRLRGDLEELLRGVGARFRFEEYENATWVTYKIETRAELGLAVSIELLPDQLNVNFGGCGLVIELAAHHPKFRSNPRAFEDWRQRCLDTVRDVLTSDLRIETRSLGGTVRGGWIWRREGESWVRCGGGGDILMFFGEKRVTEYRDWLAR
jgi:hypothetical protein